MNYVDPALLALLKNLQAKVQRARDRAYAVKQRRTYRYKGTTFITANAKDTDGWWNAWERQVERNRKRKRTR